MRKNDQKLETFRILKKVAQLAKKYGVTVKETLAELEGIRHKPSPPTFR